MDKFEIIENMEKRDVIISINTIADKLDQKELIKFYGRVKEIFGAWNDQRFNLHFSNHQYYLADFLQLVEELNSKFKNNCSVIKISFRDFSDTDFSHFRSNIETLTYRVYSALMEYLEISLFGNTTWRIKN